MSALVDGWRERPYRLFFPLGLLLAWAGLAHWILFALGIDQAYRSIYHSIAQVQGFLTCFALGFLFTALPKRTQSAPPTKFELLVGAAAPVLTTAIALPEHFAASQGPWIVLAIVMLAFTLRRFMGTRIGRRPPASFVLFPVAFALALVAIATIGFYGAFHLDFAVHQLGRTLLLQGVFLLLVVGAASLALPQITRGESVPDWKSGDLRALVPHLLGALLLVATFVIEVRGLTRTGYASRAAIVLALLLQHAELQRRPTKPGLTRKLLYAAAWMLPTGYVLAALFPNQAQLGLHVVFIGGFGLMVLAVGAHVTFAHEDRQDLAHGAPWQVKGLAVLVAFAVVARALAVVGPPQARLWLGVASLCFLLATLCCGSALVTTRRRAQQRPPSFDV